MWRYEVYNNENTLEKVSGYVYESEESAQAEAAHYVETHKKSGEGGWSSSATRE